MSTSNRADIIKYAGDFAFQVNYPKFGGIKIEILVV